MKNFFIGFILASVLVSGGYWIISRQERHSGTGNYPQKCRNTIAPCIPNMFPTSRAIALFAA